MKDLFEFINSTADTKTQNNFTAPVGNVNFDDVYKYAGKNLGYTSRYPTYNPERDNEDFYAQQQGAWDKIANTAQTFGSLTSNTFLNHFASYGRQASAIANADWSKLWKDEFGEESSRQLDAMTDLHPIYETKEQQARKNEQGGLLTAVKQFVPFSGRAGNAWAELAGQLGFTTGTILGVGAENIMLDVASGLSGGVVAPLAAEKAVSGSAKIMKSMYSLLKLDRGITDIKGAGEAISTVDKIIGSKAFSTYRQLVAAQGEAAIEANTASIEYEKNMLAKLGVNATEEDKQKIKENAKKVGNTTFTWNIPVLMASNALSIGSLFKKADLGKAAISSILKEEGEKVVAKKFTELSAKEALAPQMAKVWDIAKKAGGLAGIENFSEGAEEVLQGIGSRTAQHQYDIYNSKGSEGLTAFVAGLGEETAKTFNTREGWDEFVSGYLTGYGIHGFNMVKDRVTGAAKKEAEQRQLAQTQAEDTISSIGDYLKNVQNSTDPNTKFLKEQAAHSEGQEVAISEGNTKAAKDYQTQAKASLFNKTIRYGTSVADDMFELWGKTVEEMKKTNPTEAERMLGGRSVSEIVEGLKKDNREYAQTYDTIDKNVGNAFNRKTDPTNWQLFEDAKLLATEIEYTSKDSRARMKGVQDSLVKDYNIDESLVHSMVDGVRLVDSINTVKSTLAAQQESLKNTTVAAQKTAIQNDIDKTQEKLSLLEALKEGAFDDKGQTLRGETNPEERAAMFIKAYYGENEASVPAGVHQAIKDVIELESEAESYLSTYNLLSNKNYFEKFGLAYVSQARASINKKEKELKATEKETNKPIISPEEKYNKEQVDAALEGTTAKADVLDLLDEIDSKKREDGKYEHNGQVYDTPQELADALIKEKGEEFQTNLEQENSNGESAESVLKKALNEKRDEPLEDGAEVRTHEPSTKEQFSPKTKSASEKETFFLARNSSGSTLMHYFDLVVSRLWSPNISELRQQLINHNQNETLGFLDKAFTQLGKGSRITVINLADTNVVPIVNNDEVMVHNDGIRFFVVTKEGDAKDIIKRNLGLEVGGATSEATLVRTNAGAVVSSPFRGVNGITIESDNEIHKLRKGDDVIIRIADNKYNRDLQQELNDGKITKEQYLDRIVITAEKNGQIVGILRAADFLFENEESQEQMANFRRIFEDRQLGDKLGYAPVNGVETARGKNYNNGQLVYTNIEDYNPENYNTSFYYVKEDGSIINEKGEVVNKDDFDRQSMVPTGVYMKVEGKGNDKNHTVQLYRSDSDASSFTQEEFMSGGYKKIAQTNLSNEPIISKRIIISLNQIKDAPHVNEIEKQVAQTATSKVTTTAEEKEIKTIDAELEKLQTKLDALHAKADLLQKKVDAKIKAIKNTVLSQYKKDKRILAEEDRLAVQTAPIFVEIEDLDAKIIALQNRKDVLQTNDVAIEDTNGNTVVVSGAKVEGDAIVAQLEEQPVTIPIAEVAQVSTPEVIEQATQNQSGDVNLVSTSSVEIINELNKLKTPQEKLNWLKEKGLITPIVINGKSYTSIDYSDRIMVLAKIGKYNIPFYISTGQAGKKNVKAGNWYVVFGIGESGWINKGTEDLINKQYNSPIFQKIAKILNEGVGNFESREDNGNGKIKEDIGFLADSQEAISSFNSQMGLPITPAKNSTDSTTFFENANKILSLVDEELKNVATNKGQESTKQSEQQAPSDNLKGMSEEEAIAWIKDNANKGDIFELEDGTTIELLSDRGEELQVKVTKGQTEVAMVTPEETPPSKKQDLKVVDSFIDKLYKHGIDSKRVLTMLIQSYQKAIEAGTPITNIDDLLDASELAEDEVKDVEMMLTPVYRMALWQFLTGAETIHDIAQQEKWEEFKKTITPIIFDAQTMQRDNPPAEVQDVVKNRMVDALKKAFAQSKIGIRDFDVVKTFSLKQWNKLIDGISEALKKGAEGYFDLASKMQEFGLKTYAQGLFTVAKVSRASLGRNPVFAGDYNNIFTDVRMSVIKDGVFMVRNEKDGLFVEVSPSKKKVSDEIRNVQKDLLYLLGIDVSLDYLNAYQKINGDFSALKERAVKENDRKNSLPTFSPYQIKDVKRQGRLLLSKTPASAVEYEGVKYVNVMQLGGGENVFIEEGKALTKKEINTLVQDNKNSIAYYSKKDAAFAQTLGKLNKIKKEIENLTCN